ncbi:UTP--glucose-1-phosphate uridylyltransferase GalU [Ructibacterium gallinarum]|uniref:UTP--glucose-1-phosphate uridylyltransferase n=1 Tax=Ructibacterium gallinarum TaxID=2779355 RepID=A0A9D5M072_9FIRM|nr:UTP--glucose-1-phosphate uridylyltransferase GalU [Ructibacterium gallinarum]MBE5039741.1 UTP--glucose-1-phosphate uridylyltransferase GalU [Ructibacterium gallinarum]
MKKIKKAVIPAAGWGTRFLPATKAMPKEMLPIVDTPTIQYIVEEAVRAGIEDICVITSPYKKAVEDHFDRSRELEFTLEASGKSAMAEEIRKIGELANLVSIRQKEALGLGHAIYCAKSFVGDEPFAVLLGDDVVYNEERPCIGQLMEVYENCGTSVLGVQTVSMDDIHKYGCVDGKQVGDRLYEVRGMVEKPKKEEAPSNVAILGRYIITPEVFGYLEKTKPGAGGEIQLTDALKALAVEQGMYAYDFEGRRYDVGDRLGYLEATVEFALRREDLKDEFYRYLQKITNK